MNELSEVQRMANQIATAFQAYPEEEAVKETANHIKSFWNPRMRARLAELMANGGKELNPIAFAAGKRLGLG